MGTRELLILFRACRDQKSSGDLKVSWRERMNPISKDMTISENSQVPLQITVLILAVVTSPSLLPLILPLISTFLLVEMSLLTSSNTTSSRERNPWMPLMSTKRPSKEDLLLLTANSVRTGWTMPLSDLSPRVPPRVQAGPLMLKPTMVRSTELTLSLFQDHTPVPDKPFF